MTVPVRTETRPVVSVQRDAALGAARGGTGSRLRRWDEHWVAERLKMPHEELITDIRLLAAGGQLVSGADVYYVTRRIWWARPFDAIFSSPGFNRVMQVGYRWFARNRHCVSRACKLPPRWTETSVLASNCAIGALFSHQTPNLRRFSRGYLTENRIKSA